MARCQASFCHSRAFRTRRLCCRIAAPKTNRRGAFHRIAVPFQHPGGGLWRSRDTERPCEGSYFHGLHRRVRQNRRSEPQRSAVMAALRPNAFRANDVHTWRRSARPSQPLEVPARSDQTRCRGAGAGKGCSGWTIRSPLPGTRLTFRFPPLRGFRKTWTLAAEPWLALRGWRKTNVCGTRAGISSAPIRAAGRLS
jgi:hypothetical protein